MTVAELSTRLREAREFTGLSQEKVAARIGVSSKTISRWEQGVTPIRRYQVAALADVYGKPLDWFFDEAVA